MRGSQLGFNPLDIIESANNNVDLEMSAIEGDGVKISRLKVLLWLCCSVDVETWIIQPL